MTQKLYFDEYSNEEIRGTIGMFMKYMSFCNGHVYDTRTYNWVLDAKEYLEQILEEAFIEFDGEEQQ